MRLRPHTMTAVSWGAVMLGATGLTVAGSPPPRPPDQKAAARLLLLAGEHFRIRHTDHFTIAYDTSYEVVRPLTGRLEGTYDAVWRFCKATGLTVNPLASRLNILLFNRHEDFAAYGERVGVSTHAMAGFYHPATNLTAFCHASSSPPLKQVTVRIEQVQTRLKEMDEIRSAPPGHAKRQQALRRRLSSLRAQRGALVQRFNRFVIQHEAAHQMLFNLGVHEQGADNPLWLVEGLACQFEVPQAGTAGSLKRINQMRLADFRQALGVSSDENSLDETMYQRALAGGRLMPTLDLLRDRELFNQNEENGVFRYAQAWGLVFYLHREFRDAFATYLRPVQARQLGEAVAQDREISRFASLFGAPNAAFDRAWITYMLKLRFDPS